MSKLQIKNHHSRRNYDQVYLRQLEFLANILEIDAIEIEDQLYNSMGRLRR